jgi:hypothetical protein
VESQHIESDTDELADDREYLVERRLVVPSFETIATDGAIAA